MSHFTVLVIGPDHESQLAPFHEFECTGMDDEHIVAVDETAEYREEFAEATDAVVRLADGTLKPYFTEAGNFHPDWLREPTAEERELGKDILNMSGQNTIDWNQDRTKVVSLPEGAALVRQGTTKTFARWAAGQMGGAVFRHDETPKNKRAKDGPVYCYVQLGPSGDENGMDVRVVRRTNVTKYRWVDANGEVLGDTIASQELPAVAADRAAGKLLGEVLDTDDERPTSGRRAAPQATYMLAPGATSELAYPVRTACIGGSKWDWYQVGGRWTGYFKLKARGNGTRRISLDDRIEPEVGSPGIMTPPAEAGWADRLSKGDVDIEGMRADAAEKAGKDWDAFHAVLADHPPVDSWEQVRASVAGLDHAQDGYQAKLDVARTVYHEQPGIKALNAAGLRTWMSDEIITATRDEWVGSHIDSALSAYAVVKDGVWHERGSMGFWGMAINEVSEAAWNQKFREMFDALPDDTELTVVDCHI